MSQLPLTKTQGVLGDPAQPAISDREYSVSPRWISMSGFSRIITVRNGPFVPCESLTISIFIFSSSYKIEIGIPAGNASCVPHIDFIVISDLKDFLYKRENILAPVITGDLHDRAVS